MKKLSGLALLALLIPACGKGGGGGGHPTGPPPLLATIGSRLFEASRAGAFPTPLTGPVLGDNMNLQGLEYDALTGDLLAIDSGVGRLVRINPTTFSVTTVGLTGFHTLLALALDPVSRTLYASTGYRHMLTLDLATGLATDLGPTGGPPLTGLAFDSVNGVLYGSEDPFAGLYTVNTTTGQATSVANVTASGGLAFDPTAGVLYMFNNPTHSLIRFNPTTSSSTFFAGNINMPDLQGLAFIPGSNRLLGVGFQSLYEFNLTTGAYTLLHQLGLGGVPDLAYDPLLDVFYGVSQTLLCKIAPDGTMTRIGSTGIAAPGAIVGVAFDAATRTLYGSDVLTTASLHTLNLTTGAATPIGPLGSANIGDLAWDAGTSTLYGLYPGQLFTINTTTGAATSVGNTSGFKDSIEIHPSTGTMFATTTFPEALHTINKATGAPAQVATMAYRAASLGFSTTESAMFGTGTSLMRINVSTGAATPIGGLGLTFMGLAWDPAARKLFGLDWPTPRLFEVDRTTWTATFVAPIATQIIRPGGFAFDWDTPALWAIDLNWLLIRIDTASGAVTTTGNPGLFVSGLAYHPGLRQLFAVDLAGSDRLFTLSRTTGASTLVGPIGFTDLTCLTYDPVTSRLLAYDAATDQLIDIDPATGAGTATGRAKGAVTALTIPY
jgi:hypothetical protein